MDPTLLGKPMQAPRAQKPAGLMTRGTMLLGLGLIAALIGGVLLLASGGDNSIALQQRVAARHGAFAKIIADGQKNIVGEDLKKFNSELSLIMIGDSSAMEKSILASGSGALKKPDKMILAEETGATALAKLKDAKLNARYDSTYREVMKNQLESLRQLLRELYDATKSSTLKSTINTEYKHVSDYNQRIAELP